MKTTFKIIGCFLVALASFSVSTFAGNPCGKLSDTVGVSSKLNYSYHTTDDRVKVIPDKKGGYTVGGVKNQNVIYAGAGFVSLIGIISTVFSSAGYTSTHVPTITLAYEHGVSRHWAIGVLFDYASSSWSLENQPGDTSYSGGKNYDYANSATFTGMAAALTTTYHFITPNSRIDPYLGVALGYTSIKFNWTTTDKFSPDDGNIPLKIVASGVLFGGYVGARFYVSDHVGFWANIGYLGASGALLNIGLALKF